MKLQLLALAVLAGGLTVSALAQQKDTPLSEQDYQKLVALGKKNDEAWSKSDAAALGSLYTENAEFVTPAGILTGKEAIQKRYQDNFKDFEKRSIHVTTVSKPVEAHAIGENTAWALGQWTQTFTGADNTVKEVHGNSLVLADRDGDEWKWRVLIVNVAPQAAANATATASPTATPGN
jgi:uncharacterized protein (TIGR02246 family)